MTENNINLLIDTLSESELRELIEQCKERVLEIQSDNKTVDSCPHCGSSKFMKYGKNKFGKQRYKCSCGKVFISTTNTIIHGTWKSLNQWMTFLHHYAIGSSLEVCARECQISENTANRWRHKISMALYLSEFNDIFLEGKIELDETLYERLNAPESVKKKRGISDQKVNIACAIDENKNKIIQVSIPGRITSESLINIYKNRIKEGSIVVSDSLRSYHELMKELKVDWKKIPSKKKSIEEYTLDEVNHLHSSIKYFLAPFRGISMKYLQGYIEMYKVNEQYKKSKDTHLFNRLFEKLMSVKLTLTCSDIDKKMLNWII